MNSRFLFLMPIAAVAACGFAQIVTVDTSHAVNSFIPSQALGTTVDRVPSNATDVFFRPDQLKRVLEAGWGAVSYRQNTDLFVQAWHWNSKGTWSDPAGKGYFTGDPNPTKEMIRHSYGYSLQHRGFTRNGGTEFDGYSRLDDGDLNTYWKSNPYLTKEFTGEDDSLHPQWVVIALDKKTDVNAIRVDWADPFAVDFEVQYWVGDGDAMDDQDKGRWQTFPKGTITDAKGGMTTFGFGPVVNTKFVRILMTRSSGTCDSHGSGDRRNCVGYAIRELYLGTYDSKGFTDLLHHSPNQKQTLTLCSSVDPWHEPSDLYVHPDRMESGDQPGFDLFFTSGITRGLPAIVPIAMLYSTPEDATAQMTYLKKRGYPIRYVEMGEEADGQYMQPEDYGALYVQFARAVHKVDSNFKLGGPVFEGVTEDIRAWADAHGKTSWFGRFLDYLKSHNAISEFAFMSFEHYPYDGCETPWKNLYQEPQLLTHIMQVWRDDGLPPGTPLLDTETNAHGGEASVDIFGALWLADTFAAFLTAGGEATFYYHALSYSPPHPACSNNWGTYHLFMTNEKYEIHQPVSQFFAAQLLTKEWVQPIDAKHEVFKAASDVKDADGNLLVTAYAVMRPDGQWGLIVINKDHDRAHDVKIVFQGPTRESFFGSVDVITFGKAQYQWHPARRKGYADPDGPTARTTVQGNATTQYTLPAASVTVLRGRVK